MAIKVENARSTEQIMWVTFFGALLNNIQEMYDAVVHNLKWIAHVFTDYLFLDSPVNPNDKETVLNWIRTFIPRASTDLGSDWRSRVFLRSVIECLIPATCLRPDFCDAESEVETVKKALNALANCYHLTAVFDAWEVINCSLCFERKLIAFLLELKARVETYSMNNLNRKAKTDECSSSDSRLQPCLAKGLGLTSGYVRRLSKFNVFCETARDMDLVIEIKCGSSSCCERITNHSPKRKFPSVDTPAKQSFYQNEHCLSLEKSWVDNDMHSKTPEKEIIFGYDVQTDRVVVCFIPFEHGQHIVRIFWHGQQIRGSPYSFIVENAFEDFKKSNSAKLKPSIRRENCLRKVDEEKENDGCKKHTVRFKDDEFTINKFGKVIKRKVLRYVVKVCGKDVIVEVDSSDMLAPALLKLDYQSQGNPFHCRRNSWGFVGDTERKKSLVRQFGVDLADQDSHRRSSVQLEYDNNNKRLKHLEDIASRKKNSSLITVAEGSGSTFEDGNETSFEDSQYENENFTSVRETTPDIESSEITFPNAPEANSNFDIRCASPCVELPTSKSMNTMNEAYSAPDSRKAEIPMSTGYSSSPNNFNKQKQMPKNTKISNMQAENICEGSEHSTHEEQDLEKPSVKRKCKMYCFRKNENDNKPPRKARSKINPSNGVSFTKGRAIQKKLSFGKNVRETKKTNGIRTMKYTKKANKTSKESVSTSFESDCEYNSKLERGTSEYYVLSHNDSYEAREPQINSSTAKTIKDEFHRKADTFDEQFHPSEQNCTSTPTELSCVEFHQENVGFRQKINSNNSSRDRNDLNLPETQIIPSNISFASLKPEVSECEPSKQSLEQTHIELFSESCSQGDQGKFRVSRKIKSDLFRLKRNDVNVYEPQAIPSDIKLPSKKLEVGSCNTVGNFHNEDSIQHNVYETVEPGHELTFEKKETRPRIDVWDSNDDMSSLASKTSLDQFTSERFGNKSRSFTNLVLDKSVRDIVKDIERSPNTNSNVRELKNNFYSASLHFPPLAANNDRIRVETRIRQWETTSSLPSTPLRSKENQRVVSESLGVSSGVQSKTMFFESVQRELSRKVTKDSPQRCRTREETSRGKELNSSHGDELLGAHSPVNPLNKVAPINSCRSFDLWYLSELKNKKHRDVIVTRRPLERRLSDPGPEIQEGVESPNASLKRFNASRTSLFTSDAISSSLLFSCDQDDESEDEYIDDEIPDYAAMCLSECPAETGHLFESMQGSKSRAEECVVFGSGIYYGHVAVKNYFQVLTKGAGKGNLSVSLRGSSTHDVANINVTYVRKDIYRVTYQVMEPGYYLISVRWSDFEVPGSPFVCKVTY